MTVFALTDAESVFAVIGGLVMLAGLVGLLYSQFRSAARDATEKRLRDENEDYLRRLNYVEPKLAKAEEQNALLMQLHNPTAKLDGLSSDHGQILRVLEDQQTQLHQIHDAISGGDT